MSRPSSPQCCGQRVRDVTLQRLYRDGAAWVARPENAGTAGTHGIEVDVKLPLPAAALELHANLTRAWSRLDAVAGPDNRLAGQIPLSANAGIDYRPGGRWSAGLNATFQGGRTTRSSAELRDYNAAQCALDIDALWQIGARAKLRMSAANLAQRARRSASWYTGADGSIRRSGTTDGAATARLVLEQSF